jgi:plasmid replication initiation protein
MADKRHTQLSLPIELSKDPYFKDYVKQHWNVTFARQKKISVCAKRIMVMVLAQIRDNDFQFKKYYQIHISNVVSVDQDMKSAYKEVKKAFEELLHQYWMFEDLKTSKFIPRHILDTTKIEAKDGFECGYVNGNITVVINPALESYFLQLSHYTTYEIKHYMSFKSWYSMRMFELLAAYKDSGLWVIPIDEFRKLMDCEKKYADNTVKMLEKVLPEPLQELEGTKYAFTYKPLFDEFKKGKGRKPIVALQFNLKKVELQNIPQEWLEFSDDHKKVLLALKGFKVTEKNIVKYAKAIGIGGANKLLKEWQGKEKSDRKIDNKEKYCNAVWVRVGKAKQVEVEG